MTGSAKCGRPAGRVAILDPREELPGCSTAEPVVGRVTDQDGAIIGGVVVLLACSRGLPLEGAPALHAGQASLLRRLADALEAGAATPQVAKGVLS